MTKSKNAKTANASTSGGNPQFIPLDRLKKSPRNARKTPHPAADIEALAASIASHGMLQTPVVEPEMKHDKPTGFYLVTIGEGRRQAQLLRVKRKEIAKNELICCLLETGHDAFEISLAENAIRSPMHPADQFEAFHQMSTERGLSAEDIAAKYGITPTVVRQRLKLATVKPALIEAYRCEELNLDQLTAFAITDDHTRQQQVFDAMHSSDDREDILASLNAIYILASDPRALFVGKEAYCQAGGGILRDLFDEDNEGFFTDTVLLFDLAAKKLEAAAEAVKAEGWKWVEAMPRFNYDAVAGCRRVYPEKRELTKDEAQEMDRLAARYAELELVEDEDVTEEAERLAQAMDALSGADIYPPESLARAGAIVTISPHGELQVQRGYIRPRDDERQPAKSSRGGEGPAPVSEKLVAELTAYRTSALRNILAQQPDVAFRVLLHKLAEEAIYEFHSNASCLTLTVHAVRLDRHAPSIRATENEKAVTERHEAWAKRLPDDANTLWAFVGSLAQAAQMDLLAHCVSLSIDSVQQPGQQPKLMIGELAQAVGLDMAAHWSPTPANYLGRVSKDRILEAVREGVSKEAADNLANLKKGALAEAAAERLAGKGWRPPILRNTPPEAPVIV